MLKRVPTSLQFAELRVPACAWRVNKDLPHTLACVFLLVGQKEKIVSTREGPKKHDRPAAPERP